MWTQKCPRCHSNESSLGGWCRNCVELINNSGEEFKNLEAKKWIEGYANLIQNAAGQCGKCGAPYTIENGNYKPICVCWNLPKPGEYPGAKIDKFYYDEFTKRTGGDTK